MITSRKQQDLNGLSIGYVAELTGISVFNLRTWERRYGVLPSTKLASGHRRYSAQDVERLKKVKAALDAGGKISKVLEWSDEELDSFQQENAVAGSIEDQPITRLIDVARRWDDVALYQALDSEWKALGPIGFVNARAIRLLERVGEGWAAGQVSIALEHFVSGVLQRFLFEKWSAADQQNDSPRVVLCSLEGEDHAFGVHFCAVASSVSGFKNVYLGTSVPDEDIVAAVAASQCFAVCISISRFYDPNTALKKLKAIRKQLPTHVELIVGGAGAPSDVKGVRTIRDFQMLYDWLTSSKQV